MPNLKDQCLKYFKRQPTSDDHWICSCGKVLKQRKNTGWSNLMSHINLQHGDLWKGKENKEPKQTTIEISSAKAKCVYSWLEWVCMELKPFSFVESELTRKYSLLSPISKKRCKNT